MWTFRFGRICVCEGYHTFSLSGAWARDPRQRSWSRETSSNVGVYKALWSWQLRNIPVRPLKPVESYLWGSWAQSSNFTHQSCPDLHPWTENMTHMRVHKHFSPWTDELKWIKYPFKWRMLHLFISHPLTSPAFTVRGYSKPSRDVDHMTPDRETPNSECLKWLFLCFACRKEWSWGARGQTRD